MLVHVSMYVGVPNFVNRSPFLSTIETEPYTKFIITIKCLTSTQHQYELEKVLLDPIVLLTVKKFLLALYRFWKSVTTSVLKNWFEALVSSWEVETNVNLFVNLTHSRLVHTCFSAQWELWQARKQVQSKTVICFTFTDHFNQCRTNQGQINVQYRMITTRFPTMTVVYTGKFSSNYFLQDTVLWFKRNGTQ